MTLLEAIKQENIEEVKEALILDPPCIDDVDEDGHLMTFVAASTGNFEIVKYIVEYSRASMNIRDKEERTILHYAAQSGNKDLCQYLVERVGLSITEPDINLSTPFDIAYYGEKKEVLEYFEEYLQYKFSDSYHNPIRHGMFPDPSIVRVGSDYYMVNSSFIFFPCIPISHSKDLINWNIIGYAITNKEWAGLDNLEGGRGYWAPDISYNNGTFYITATYRLNDDGRVLRRQIVVSSDKPEGPYSEPAFIEEDGIDPSIFHDDDGRHYMLLNRGARIFELSSDCKKQISEATLLFYGDNKRAPEGPHLIKKDGYYYLFEAEGGTGEGHMETVSRSRNLMGPYEPCPYNPIMRQNNTNATIWRCGHGKPFNTPEGDWYMVYLCGRKFRRNGLEAPFVISPLGRETAIDKMEFTADGWPIVNGLKGPSAIAKKPYPEIKTDVIDNNRLEWITPRPPEDGAILIDEESYIIKASTNSLSTKEARNILLRRQTAFDFKASVMLNLADDMVNKEAGLTCYYDENTYICFYISEDEEGLFIKLKEHIGHNDIDHAKQYIKASDVDCMRFEIETRGLERYFAASGYNNGKGDEALFKIEDKANDVYYLCDEGIKMGKRFTGALVGMYAYDEAGALKAEFSNFSYEEIV